MKFFDELKRRNVIKATMAYVVVNWVLIQVLTIILPVFQAPDWVLQTLMILMAVGFPIWVIFSWVYEVTPEGLKKTSEVPKGESTTEITNKRLNVIILVVLLIAIAVSFINRSDAEPEIEAAGTVEMTKQNAIAVLPFIDMSPNKDQEFYSDGVAIEILNSLCKFKQLKVVGGTSSFSFKNQAIDIKSIGDKLDVNNVLEGSVQTQQNRIVISVRLTNAENGFTIFSETYTDELDNIYELQTKIAKDVAQRIGSELNLADNMIHSRKKINSLAYETFLKGKLQFVNGPLNMNPDEANRAKKYFSAAVILDSSFAEANAYLSLVYFNLADWVISSADNLKRQMVLDSARLLAQRAHSLDSLSSGAHLAMGSYYFHEYNWIQAEREKRKAVELNPGGAQEKFILASFLGQFGHSDEALSLDQEAMKLDPLDVKGKMAYVRDLYTVGRYEECIHYCNLMLEEDPGIGVADQFRWLCYAGKKDFEKAGEVFAHFAKDHLKDTIAARFFKDNEFKTAVKKMMAYNKESHIGLLQPNFNKASFFAFIEDKENTIKYLWETYDNREPMISYMRDWRFDFIKDDPGYISLYDKAGFKAYDEHSKKVKNQE